MLALVLANAYAQAQGSASGYGSSQEWFNTYVTPVVPQGKSWEDKHFREALMSGPKRGGWFTMVNEGNKEVSKSKLMEYCENHKFLCKKVSTRSLKKFGTTVETVDELEFIPESLFMFYVFESSGFGDCKSLTQKGDVQFYQQPKFITLHDALWSGSSVNGKVDGTGAGVLKQSSNVYYCFSGTFRQGIPCGMVQYRRVDVSVDNWTRSTEETNSKKLKGGTPTTELRVDDLDGNAALFCLTSNNHFGILEVSNGLVNVTLEPSLTDVKSKFHDGKVKIVRDNKEIFVDRFGNFVDYADEQKQLIAAEKEKERQAELARQQAEAEKKRQEELAALEAAERARQEAIYEANLQRRIDANKNTKLWIRGCRLAYRYPDSHNYIIATLESWNEDRSKVKVRIVTSPSSVMTYKGDMLSKGNEMWVSSRNEGWHLALDEEIAEALGNDGSIVITCMACNGRGTIPCSTCDGTGQVKKRDYWVDCGRCHGKGSKMCYLCNGKGTR